MRQENAHILIVDDHKDIRDPLAQYLRKNGFRTSQAANGLKMDQILKSAAIDLVILDVMMPGENGLEICRRLRETRDMPVILLTAMAEDTDKIVGLEIGADDYVTKPFNPRELVARIRGVLRRLNALPKTFADLEAGYIAFGDWILNVDQHSLKKQGTEDEVTLSTADFKLLTTFLKHAKMVLSRDQLLEMVSNRSADIFDRTIDNQVSRLRKKIETDPKNPVIIKTVWGGGYMLSVDAIKR